MAVLACPIIAATGFGNEFSYGTISQLLAQPVDRRRIWFEKMLVLAIALATLLLGGLLLFGQSIRGEVLWTVLFIPICVFCATPFFTLAARSTIGGVILSIATPILIYLGAGALILGLIRIGAVTALPGSDQPFNERRLHFWLITYFGVALPLYCAIFYYLGSRRFRRLEVADLFERQIRISLPGTFKPLVNRVCSTRHFLSALIGKELHLQNSALGLLVVFTVLQFAALLFINLARPEDPESYFIVPLFIYAALMPLVIGASAIAEEQRLGTRAWHLTIPVSPIAQWFIKLSVVIVATTLLSLAVPLFWLMIGHYIVSAKLELPNAVGLFVFWSLILGITSVTFYASSFSRDTLRALLVGGALCIGLTFSTIMVSELIERMGWTSGQLFRPVANLLSAPTVSLFQSNTVQTAILAIPLVCAVILPLLASLKHFRRLDHSTKQIWSNAVLVFLPALIIFFVLINFVFAVNSVPRVAFPTGTNLYPALR